MKDTTTYSIIVHLYYKFICSVIFEGKVYLFKLHCIDIQKCMNSGEIRLDCVDFNFDLHLIQSQSQSINSNGD